MLFKTISNMIDRDYTNLFYNHNFCCPRMYGAKVCIFSFFLKHVFEFLPWHDYAAINTQSAS